ncbi:GNAT family N-acetyltransferase [Pseudoduganella danionis]|uniref:GNAT family N-acetyltransferase n=1 Tax=Pseudoduganella danionis TaxID=1890295 RepID=UPI0035B01942
MLLEAIIFLLDMDTGASISYAPFLSIPTAMAAWWLGRWPALLFVVLSTAARVIDYSIMRVPHQSPLMLTYDILQSAAFYGCVALIALALRRQRDHLLKHARHIRSSVRHERHLRHLDSSIRRAVPDDVPAIIRLTSLAGASGNFDQIVTDSVRQAALDSSFRAGILQGSALRDVWGGGQCTVPIEFWVAEFEGEVHSYMMLLGVNQQDVLARELHAMVVDPRYRGHGLGNLMVDFFCAHYKQRALIAACRPDSTMLYMLLKRGFTQTSVSDQGYLLLRRVS